MAFEFDRWRSDVRHWWHHNAEAVRTGAFALGARSAYGAAVLSTFAPLVAMLGQASPAEVQAALAGISGAVGGNLLANMLERARANASVANSETVDELVGELLARADDATVRDAIDAAVFAGGALDASAEKLGHAWEAYAERLTDDLDAIGGAPRSAAIVQRIRANRIQDVAGHDVIKADNGGTVFGPGATVSYGLSGDDLAVLLERIESLIRRPGSQIEGSAVRDAVDVLAGDSAVSITRDGFASAPVPGTPAAWLRTKALDDTFKGLDERFVPLAAYEKPRADLAARILGEHGQVTQESLPDVRDALAKYERFVLTGDPGGGKTTVLRKLAADQFAAAASDPDGGRIPFYVKLSRHKSGDPSTFLETQWADQGYAAGMGASFASVRDAGRLLLLADGLNEMPRDRLAEQMVAWGAWVAEAADFPAGNQAVFACRTLDYQWPLALQEVIVLPLKDERVVEFLARHLKQAEAEQLWARLQRDDQACRAEGRGHRSLLELARNPFALFLLTESFRESGDLPNNGGVLFAGFCAKLVDREIERRVHAETLTTPQKKLARALLAAHSTLAYAMQETAEGTELARDDAAAALHGGGIPSDEVLLWGYGARLLSLDEDADSDEALVAFTHQLLQEALAARELLRRFRGGESLNELWRCIRLPSEMPEPDGHGPWQPLPPPPGTGWEETTILAAGLAEAEDARLRARGKPLNPPLVEQFIAAVRGPNPILAARCLDEAGPKLAEQVPDALVSGIRDDLLADLRQAGVHVRARLEAGRRLGAIGDPRFKRTVPSAGPAFISPALCRVPAGTYIIGNPDDTADPQHDPDALTDEQHGHEIDVAEFWIGKYPVTNAEFRCFVEAKGYEQEEWWDEAGWGWCQGVDAGGFAVQLQLARFYAAIPNEDWARLKLTRPKEEHEAIEMMRQLSEDQLTEILREGLARQRRDQPVFWDDLAYADWTGDNQPVIGVSWHEARAYCRWLSARWRASEGVSEVRIPANHEIRLPTEAEWEAAGRGPEARRYPWGLEFDNDLANTLDGRVLRVSPVGAYPGGVAHCGAHDMAGNVWEWTLSLWGNDVQSPNFDYPYDPTDGREDETAGGGVLRVVRGGSWSYLSRYARCACRYWYVPDDRNDSLGFRVVVAAPTRGR